MGWINTFLFIKVYEWVFIPKILHPVHMVTAAGYNCAIQSILWVSEYCKISALLRLHLSDFKLQASHTMHAVKLSKEHFTCCWKQGLINQLIRVVSREPGHTLIVWTEILVLLCQQLPSFITATSQCSTTTNYVSIHTR